MPANATHPPPSVLAACTPGPRDAAQKNNKIQIKNWCYFKLKIGVMHLHLYACLCMYNYIIFTVDSKNKNKQRNNNKKATLNYVV